MSKLTELLNARHQDLDFELGMLANNRQLLKEVAEKLDIVAETNTIVSALQNHLVDKLGVDVEEIAEDEEIDVEDVTDAMIYDYLGEAYFAAGTEMKSFLQFDNIVNNMQKLGATEEELKGLQSFKKRLEKNVYDRYDVTEEDLKEEEDE
jgi:hypothetical protein